MGQEATELPLLQPHTTNTLNQRRVLAAPSMESYGSSPATESSPRWQRSRSLVQRALPVVAYIALGCGASLLVQGRFGTAPSASSVVDFTHGNGVRHALQVDLDSLSMCPNASALVEAEKEKEKEAVSMKESTWFLGGDDPQILVTSLPPVTSLDDLPKHWDWRDYNGTGISLVTSVQNQMMPKPCGSCWAVATTSALSDRIRIAQFKKTGKVGPEILITPQPLLDCGMRSFGSCSGGDPRYAHKWIHENGIVDVTCSPYIASHPSWQDSKHTCAASQCRHCSLDFGCKVNPTPKKYYVSEYGTLNATTSAEFELEAMNEIYHRGPIVVSMYSHTPEYANYKGGFVLRNSDKFPGTTHVVSLVGWGTDENGVKYWVVRNSYGTNWGDNGFFLAERGTNTYNLELHGAWAVPIV